MTIVIYGSKYWKNVIDLELLAEKGAIAVSDVDLFQFADTPEEAFKVLTEGLIANHLDPAELAAMGEGSVSSEPEADTQSLLGPDIAKTRS
jgi:hypothetical protein